MCFVKTASLHVKIGNSENAELECSSCPKTCHICMSRVWCQYKKNFRCLPFDGKSYLEQPLTLIS